MSFNAFTWVMDLDLPNTNCFAVLSCMASYADEKGVCWPSQQTIADKTKLARETVSRTIKKLRDLDLVTQEGRVYVLNLNVTQDHNCVTDDHNSENGNVTDDHTTVTEDHTDVTDDHSHLNQSINQSINPITEMSPPDICHSENKIQNVKSSRQGITNSRFEEFWELYPRQRRGNKQKALRSYLKALKEDRATEEEIINGLQSYRISNEVKRGFAKGAAAWLSDDRWSNDYGRGAGQQQSVTEHAEQCVEDVLAEYGVPTESVPGESQYDSQNGSTTVRHSEHLRVQTGSIEKQDESYDRGAFPILEG